jgi:uncharacterized protein YqjF (DUF2071 family)
MTAIQAPHGAIERMRRPLAFGHVLVTIEHALIVTWRIPLADLRKTLPAALEPVADGGEGFLSAVIFRNRGLRPARVGFPRLSSCQMNIRSYVRDPVTRDPGSVYFHGLYLSRRWIAAASSLLFRVPFRYLPFAITAPIDEGGAWAAVDRADRMDVAAGAADETSDPRLLDLLTNPHTGYFTDRSGALRKWSIWHRAQELRVMKVTRAHIADLPIVGPRDPWNGLYVRSVDYEVYLPPTPAS